MRNVISPRQSEDGKINIITTDQIVADIQYLDLRSAARFMFVSVSKLQKLSAKRVIPVYKPTNGKVYFKKQDLIDFIESGRQKSIYEIESEAIKAMANNARLEKSNKSVKKHNMVLDDRG